MVDYRVFVSFEFDKDNDLKNNFYTQALEHSPYRIQDSSLKEDYPDQRWQRRAATAISRCDIVVVLVGQDTHNASGVKAEVELAKRLGKPILQIVPKKRPYRGLSDLEPPIRWKWARINPKIRQLCMR